MTTARTRTLRNAQVILVARPTGSIGPEHFEVRATPVPEPQDGELLVRNIYSSVEPYLRVLMSRDMLYAKKFELHAPLPARVVGEVVRSRHRGYKEGDHVYAMLHWEEYSLVRGGDSVRHVDPTLAPLSAYVGVLGPSGLTAYIGMLELGEPKAGDSAYVSAAAGAVGHLAGQLARLRGARVIGSVGSDEKVDFVTRELGFEGAFNYKSTADLTRTLRDFFPEGIDLDFENVGGPNLDAVLECMSVGARIILCGTVSQYNEDTPYGIRNIPMMFMKRARMIGFSVRDHEHRLPEYILQMSTWLREGRIKYRETITRGVENGPAVLAAMMRGENVGKQILQIGEDASRRGG